MSAIHSSSTSMSKSKSSASIPRVAGLKSTSPNLTRPSTKDKQDEVNRKLDYLLKKTRKLEDSLSNVRKENSTLMLQNKKTQECTVNMWESIKNCRDSVTPSSEEIVSLRTKLDVLNQKTVLLESNKYYHGVKAEEVGAISEQVFSRVHREFGTVVDEVVRACVKEQVDFLTKWTAKGGMEKDSLLMEENKTLAAQISTLQKQHKDSMKSLSDLQSYTHDLAAEQKATLSDAMSSTQSETQHLLESVTKRMNESIAFAVSNFQEEMSSKYDGTMHQVINSCNDLQVRIAECEEQISSVEGNVADVNEKGKQGERELEAVLSEVKKTRKEVQSSVEGVRQKIERVKGEVVADLRQREENKEIEVKLKESTTGSETAQLIAQQTKDDLSLVTVELEQLTDQVNRHGISLGSYLHLLEEHRRDFNETISRLSSAGRDSKAAHKGLCEEVRLMKSEQDDAERKMQEDRDAVGRVVKESGRVLALVSECQKGLAGAKKSKKKAKSDEEGVTEGELGVRAPEVSALKERMDLLEESVIDTVQDMVNRNTNSDTLAATQKKMDKLENSVKKQRRLVEERVDKVLREEILPLVGRVDKVERGVNGVKERVKKCEVWCATATATATGATAKSTNNAPSTTAESPTVTSFGDIVSSVDAVIAPREEHVDDAIIPETSNETHTLIPPHRPATEHPPPSNAQSTTSQPSLNQFSTSSTGTLFSNRTSNIGTVPEQPPVCGNLHSGSSRSMWPATDPIIHPLTALTPSGIDSAYRPQHHSPQPLNLTSAGDLSSAQEIMLPGSGVPSLSSIPDLRKSHKSMSAQPVSVLASSPQRSRASPSPHSNESQPRGRDRLGHQLDNAMSSDRGPVLRDTHDHHHHQSNINITTPSVKSLGPGCKTPGSKSHVHDKTSHHRSPHDKSTPPSSSLSSSSSPQVEEVLLKSLQEKKQQHRKKFQSQVKCPEV